MSIAAIALAAVWLSLPEQLRYGCYLVLAVAAIILVLAAVFGWPVAVGVAVAGLIKGMRSRASRDVTAWTVQPARPFRVNAGGGLHRRRRL